MTKGYLWSRNSLPVLLAILARPPNCGFVGRAGPSRQLTVGSVNANRKKNSMTEGKVCPFCGAKAATGCAHLALAARATDFVERCVERCQGEWFWQLLINNECNPLWLHRFRKDDFLWLESSFSSQFMEPLVWFGRMEYEWREGGPASGREMWVLLWSKDPQRFWWNLRDELENQTDGFERSGEPSGQCVEDEEDGERAEVCPVCGDNSEEECAHLAFHGDDLRTQAVVEECVETADWEILATQTPECAPEFASDFFDKFGDQFPSFIKIQTVGWEGGAPGLSGVYAYVWSKNSVKLLNEISAFLERKLAKLKGLKLQAGPSQIKKLKVRARRAKRATKGRGSG